MSTMTGNKWGGRLAGGFAAVAMLVAAGVARADVASDQAGAILIFPKIVVDTSGVFGPPKNTEIQITNASNSVISVRCYWIDATSHCSNDLTQACTAESESSVATRLCPTNGICTPQWVERNFRFTLTKRQPISFNALDGLVTFPLSASRGIGGQSNNNSDGSQSSIPGVANDPFFGELRCVQVDTENFLPTAGLNPANNGAGDLVGHATIVSASRAAVDARKYNAIGIQSTTVNNNDNTLLIGGGGAEYNGCPNVLILNHLFDNAAVGTHSTGGGGSFTESSLVTTDVTFVPCGENINLQENDLGGGVLQFLVFNEFEQRFSTSTSYSCWRELQLSDLDTRAGTSDNNKSIFNVAVEGTLSGQTRIRSVTNGTRANGVLAIAERFFVCTSGPNERCSSAENLHFTGSRTLGDTMVLSDE